jgi:hypothetical protein
MEGEAIRRFARAEVQRPGGSKIGSIVTDGETSARRIFDELKWNVMQLADPNHLRVCLKRCFERCKFITREGRSNRKNVLRGLEAGLFMHYHFCVRSGLTADEKLAKWSGAVEHYTSEESDWDQKDDRLAVAQLRGFIEASAEMVVRYQEAGSTQANEGINFLIHLLASKYASWRQRIPRG